MRTQSKRFSPDPEAARAKRAEALARLEAGIAAIQDSDSFKSYLRMAARFHHYSFRNQLLIAMQRPDATRVAGFHAWKDLGRSVKKGAKGIAIIVPRTYGKRTAEQTMAESVRAQEDETDEPGVYFATGYVFDVSDTEGEDLPNLDYRHTTGATAHELWGRIERYVAAHNLAITSEPREQGPTGFYQPATRTIWHDPTLQLDGRASTVLHELAHSIDPHSEIASDYAAHRGERETVAEAVAFIVASHFGLDTAGESFVYVAKWSADRETFKRALAQIQQLSDTLITDLEGV